MGFKDFFIKKPNQSTRIAQTQGARIVHRGRVDVAEASWYNSYRGYLNSPNGEVRRQLTKTRDLSRLLTTIDPFASKALELISVYVTGPQGILLEPKVVDYNGVLDTNVNAKIKAAWDEWCDEGASFDGRSSWKDIEETGIRSVWRDGEALVRIVRGKSASKWGISLQVIDPALLDVDYEATLQHGGYITMGIEYSRTGRVAAYHIWNRYLDSPIASVGSKKDGRIRERIPADEIIHVYHSDNANGARGLPWNIAGLAQLGRLHDYMEVSLQAAAVAASAPMTLTTTNVPSTDMSDLSATNQVNSDGTTTTTNLPPQDFLNLQGMYAQVIKLDPNTKLEATNLQFPQNNFEGFVKTTLQSIATAFHISYTTLTSDGSDESYSSGRRLTQIESDFWSGIQVFYARNFHRVVYRAWLETAMLSGALVLPTDNPEDYYKVEWKTKGQEHVDVVKQANGYKIMRDNGWQSSTEICAARGQNFRDVIDAIADENAYAASKGVPLQAIQDKLSLAQQVQALETPQPKDATPAKKKRAKKSTEKN